MDFKLEKKDSVNASLQVIVKQEDYKEKYANKLKEYSKKAQIKGFRPGKVPSTLVEKMYGKSILVDEINSLLSESINKYLNENDIHILGDPIPKRDDNQPIDWDVQKEFSFTYQLGLEPKFDLELSEKLTFEKATVEVDDAEVQKTIENLRKQFGKYEDGQVVEPEVMVYADLVAVGQTEPIFKFVSPYEHISDTTKKVFDGKMINDTFNLDIRTALVDDATIAYALGIDKSAAAALSGDYTFTITKISKPTLAELNEDFYKKVMRTEESLTFEDFKEKVRSLMTESYVEESTNVLYMQLYDYFTKNTKITYPKEFLKEWLMIANEKKLTKEQIEIQYPDFELGLTWDLIKNKLAREYKIDVQHEDVIKRAKSAIRRQFGLSTLADEETEKLLEGFADNMLKKDNGKEYRKYFDEVYNEKVFECISSKVKLKDKKYSVQAFNNMVSEFKKKNI